MKYTVAVVIGIVWVLAFVIAIFTQQVVLIRGVLPLISLVMLLWLGYITITLFKEDLMKKNQNRQSEQSQDFNSNKKQ